LKVIKSYNYSITESIF